jgi:hypothetical protein
LCANTTDTRSKWLTYEKKFHVLGIAALCWAIRKAHKASFEGKLIKNSIEILCPACALMRFWAGLYADGAKEALIEGINIM